MKLIIAIVQDEDASRLVSNLMNEGYGVTKLATTGGFLRAGNTTLLVGVDDDKFDGAMSVIEKVCKSRKQMATSPSPVAGTTGVEIPELAKILGFFPDETCTPEDGIFVARNYGERIAVRGGKAGSLDRAGLNALHFYNPRTYDGSATIGFRSAYVDIDM